MKKLFILMTAGLVVASCNNDIDTYLDAADVGNKVTVKVSTASQTRVDVNEDGDSWSVTWSASDALGCWSLDEADSSSSRFDITANDAGGSSASFSGSLPSQATMMRFVHPYSSSFAKDANNEISLSLASQSVGGDFSHLGATTYMISNAFEVDASSGAVTSDTAINMSHIGAAIEFKLKFSVATALEEADYTITQVVVGDDDVVLPLEGSVNVVSGEFTATKSEKLVIAASNVADVDGIYTIRCSTFPFTLAAGTTLPVEVTFEDEDGAEHIAYASVSVSKETEFARATKNTVYALLGDFVDEYTTATITGIATDQLESLILAAKADGTLDSDLTVYNRLVLQGGGLGSDDFTPLKSYFPNLECVDLSATTITAIGGSAFANYTSLKKIFFPSTLKTVQGSAFSGCSSLQSVELPEGVTTLAGSAFADCTSLVSANIPSTVITLGGLTYARCTALIDVDLAEGLVIMGQNTFLNCTGLKQITIPSTITSWAPGVASSTFSGCTSLETVVFQEGVTTIGAVAFFNCTSLKAINLPSTLKSWEVNPSNQSLAFQNCTGATTISIPEGVEEIGALTFASCGFEEVTIPSSVTSWPISAAYVNQAFQACASLKTVVLADGLTCITGNTFQGSSEISSFTSLSQVPPTIIGVGEAGTVVYPISGGSGGVVIKIPAGCTAAYKAATGWSAHSYSEIEE
ncbi:MAG: leucine-rich repeat domain-containing protein [Rikenellaceae bacterium]